MDSYNILNAVYQIQGLADPNESPKSLEERMREIYDLACHVMEQTGFQPDSNDF